VYIDKDGNLQVGPSEIPTAECLEFGDERYMAQPHDTRAEAIAEASRDLQERVAELEQRELALVVRENRMEDLRAKCIEILSTTFNCNSTNK
jgi:excinuclease UvrABC helicase subunit UvrB